MPLQTRLSLTSETPSALGAFVTIYAFLLTFWGTAWMLFMYDHSFSAETLLSRLTRDPLRSIGWLGAGDRQDYWVEICDQILVALFCLTGCE